MEDETNRILIIVEERWRQKKEESKISSSEVRKNTFTYAKEKGGKDTYIAYMVANILKQSHELLMPVACARMTGVPLLLLFSKWQ